MNTTLSVGEQIVAKMVELLNAPDNKPKETVRQRPQPITSEYPDGESGLDAFLLYSLKEDSQKLSPNLVERTRHVRIEIPVSGPPPLDAAADEFYLFVIRALFNNSAMDQLRKVNIADGATATPRFSLEEVGLIWETISTYVDMSVCALELKFVFATTIDPSVRV